LAITHEIIARGETYKDKEGNDKTRWIRCGVVMDTKSGGQAIHLESLPINFDGWLMMKEPMPKENQKPYSKSGSVSEKPIEDIESDIPFN
jgi:hypothetical protein